MCVDMLCAFVLVRVPLVAARMCVTIRPVAVRVVRSRAVPRACLAAHPHAGWKGANTAIRNVLGVLRRDFIVSTIFERHDRVTLDVPVAVTALASRVTLARNDMGIAKGIGIRRGVIVTNRVATTITVLIRCTATQQ